MQTQRYRFEKEVEVVNQDSKSWLETEMISILESDKDYTRKADYIGLSIISIDNKISSIDEEIKELQDHKKNLKSAKEIALEVGAKVFAKYGIDKIEGLGISSITLVNPISKTKVSLNVRSEAYLIQNGFFKTILDEDAVIKALETDTENAELHRYCSLTKEIITSAAKIKINKKRTVKKDKEIEVYYEIA